MLSEIYTNLVKFLPFSDAVAVRGAFYGNGSGDILNNLQCTGDEQSLLECEMIESSLRSKRSCNHSEDAGVKCGGTCMECLQPARKTINISQTTFL